MRRLVITLVIVGLGVVAFLYGGGGFYLLILAQLVLIPLDGQIDVGDGREGFLIPNELGWFILLAPLGAIICFLVCGVVIGSRPRRAAPPPDSVPPPDDTRRDLQSAATHPGALRIDGRSVRAFEESYEELQASLTPEQRDRLRYKLERLQVAAQAMEPEASPVIAKAFLLDRLHGLDYDGILALHEHWSPL